MDEEKESLEGKLDELMLGLEVALLTLDELREKLLNAQGAICLMYADFGCAGKRREKAGGGNVVPFPRAPKTGEPSQ